MAGYIQGINPNQMMFPMTLEEIIEEDNPVRGIAAIVDGMNLNRLNFVHDKTKKTGRPPHDPKKIFKLYLYCYYNKIRSSRAMEKECKRNIELMWLMDGIVPDHKCIADFRKNNKHSIEEGHKEFIRICTELGLVGKDIVAVDGTKIRANNSRKSNVTLSKLDKIIGHYEESIHEYLGQLAENDISENQSNINSKIKKAKQHIAKCQQLKEDMEAQGIKEISITDPDSHQMGVSNKGTDICYNIQNAVDSKEHLIVTTDVTSSPADQTQLYHMASKLVDELEITEEEAIVILADKGYWKAEDLAKCVEDKRIDAIVSPPAVKGNEGFKKSDFQYDEKTDSYICPKGIVLHRIGAKDRHYVNNSGCKKCEFRELCTKRIRGRIIERGEYEEALEISKEMYIENKDIYHLRQELVEHPFGTIKRTLGFTYFLTRGLVNVRTENFLHALTYNLKRVLNIYSIPDLLCALSIIKAKESEGIPSDSLLFAIISAIFKKRFNILVKLATP